MDLHKVLEVSVEQAAKRLLGALVIRDLNGARVIGKIVETECYHQNDAASHSFKGETPRTSVMFGPAGRAYVYFTYGMHYCFNVVTGHNGEGSAVLIRALEPVDGLEVLMNNRKGRTGRELTNGPAKLCQAMAIDLDLNKHDLSQPPLMVHLQPPVRESRIVSTTRIGITKAIDKPWRFYLRNNPYVSRP